MRIEADIPRFQAPLLSEGLGENWRYAIAVAAAALSLIPSVVYDRYARRHDSLTYRILRLF